MSSLPWTARQRRRSADASAFASAQQSFASIRRIARGYARPDTEPSDIAVLLDLRLQWGGSSAGRASRSQCEGREFDPPPLHHSNSTTGPPGPFSLPDRRPPTATLAVAASHAPA